MTTDIQGYDPFEGLIVHNKCPKCCRFVKNREVTIHNRCMGEEITRIEGLECPRCGPFDASEVGYLIKDSK
jgi:hypothetical protein